MLIDRKLVAIIVVCLAAGWWLGSSPSSPINPQPQRPVLLKLSRVAMFAARLGLRLALFAEPAPQSSQNPQQLVRGPAVDAEGHRVLNHGEGW